MGLGITSLAMQIKESNVIVANIMLVCGYAGCIGEFFVYACLCIQAIVYKAIMRENRFDLQIKH